MAAKRKFEGLEQQTAELNLKKRAVAEVQWHLGNPSAHLVLKNFVEPFEKAKKKDDLSDALLQLLSHVGWKHDYCGGDQPIEASAPDFGEIEDQVKESEPQESGPRSQSPRSQSPRSRSPRSRSPRSRSPRARTRTT